MQYFYVQTEERLSQDKHSKCSGSSLQGMSTPRLQSL